MAGLLIFARRGMVSGRAANRLQGVWKSIDMVCGRVAGWFSGRMQLGCYAVIRCKQAQEDLGYLGVLRVGRVFNR